MGEFGDQKNNESAQRISERVLKGSAGQSFVVVPWSKVTIIFFYLQLDSKHG